MPYQVSALSIAFSPRRSSLNVGTSGITGERASPVIAYTLILPAL